MWVQELQCNCSLQQLAQGQARNAHSDRCPATRTVQLAEELMVVHDVAPLPANGGGTGEHLGSRGEAPEDLEVQLLRQADSHCGVVEVKILT